MFSTVLSSIGKLLWKEDAHSLVQIPSGEFYGWRKHSGHKDKHALKECLYDMTIHTCQLHTHQNSNIKWRIW